MERRLKDRCLIWRRRPATEVESFAGRVWTFGTWEECGTAIRRLGWAARSTVAPSMFIFLATFGRNKFLAKRMSILQWKHMPCKPTS